ncbi:MAG: hypothetical protein AB1585_10715 [Thermodesulfobacteriota bacterium]
MFKLKIDTAKNRLYVTLIGFFPPIEMAKWSGETIAAAKKMKRGYDVIIDLSQFKPTTPEGTKEIEKVQSFFKLSGAKQGVQVIGDNVLGGLQFKRMSITSGFDPSNVNTLAEAEKLLGP